MLADDRAVGYGRPPAHSQFKKGQSGNPHGRRKNSKSLKTLIRQALTGLITIREGEKRRSINKLEGVVLRQVEGTAMSNALQFLRLLRKREQVLDVGRANRIMRELLLALFARPQPV